MHKENCLKKTEVNTVNQKLITIQQNHENKLKDVTKHQFDVKRISKEKAGEQKQITIKKRLNPQKKAELEKQYSNLKSINLRLETKTGHQDKERTT